MWVLLRRLGLIRAGVLTDAGLPPGILLDRDGKPVLDNAGNYILVS